MILDIAVEHRFPKLHSGPHHMLLYTAVSKLSNACAQFLSDKNRKKNSYEQSKYYRTGTKSTIIIKISLTINADTKISC